jgi:hypothetical protein
MLVVAVGLGGIILWSARTAGTVDSNAALAVSGDTVYMLGTSTFTLYAFDKAAGAPRGWSGVSSSAFASAPVVGADGLVYLAQPQTSPAQQLNVVAIDPATGDLAWEGSYDTRGLSGAVTLALGAPGVLVASSASYVLALSAPPAAAGGAAASPLERYAIYAAAAAGGLILLCGCVACCRSRAFWGGGSAAEGDDNPFRSGGGGGGGGFTALFGGAKRAGDAPLLWEGGGGGDGGGWAASGD